ELNARLLNIVKAGEKKMPLPEIALGMQGIKVSITASAHNGWRNHELVKLRIRDRRKTAKKYLPYIRK
ncbi:hypothetical protein TSOC_015464, partial [Tetrabaena socialis]